MWVTTATYLSKKGAYNTKNSVMQFSLNKNYRIKIKAHKTTNVIYSVSTTY